MSHPSASSLCGESARRQLRLSISTVLLMAMGAFVAGFLAPAQTASNARTLEDGGAFIGRLVASEE